MPHFIRLGWGLATAGIGAFIWHWGAGIGLIIICVVLAYFTTAVPIIGPWLTDARRHLLWAAFVIATFLAGQWLGAHDANRRHAKQQVVIGNTVDQVVRDTKTDKFQKRQDRYDRPEH